ncbi:hypothetical protein NB704_003051 [Pantoea ananatis]|nr:hypothetical protein [Pantoea ananatis]
MKTEQPLWGRGVMVSPQHFQQQVAYAAWSAESIARMGLSQPWGVINVAFEPETLTLGRLQARHLHIRFPDGTPPVLPEKTLAMMTIFSVSGRRSISFPVSIPG